MKTDLTNHITIRPNFTRRQFVEKSLMGSAGIIAGTAGLMAQNAPARNISASPITISAFLLSIDFVDIHDHLFLGGLFILHIGFSVVTFRVLNFVNQYI